MKKIQNKEVILNIFKRPLLRYTLLITIATAFFLPVYSFYYSFPQFNNQLTQYTEDLSVRIATHLKQTIFIHGESLTNQSFSQEVVKEILRLTKNLRIEKIKIFSDSGIILFSSNSEDIGQKNNHDYFYKQIALGNTYSKVVKKNTKTLEERTVNTEVVESYIPLMQEGIFKGAVEVYYDITENMKDLSELLNNLKIIISVFSLVVLIGLLNILFKSSRNTLIKEIAERSLQEAHSELEQIVADRTIDLEKTNRSLMHEIQERKNTAMSLQRSNDTQTIINKLLGESLGDALNKNIIDTCLDLVLSLSWLSFDSMGCIYLVEDTPNVLVMKAHRGFSEDLQRRCTKIPFGKCLCGRAASEQKIVFASNIDERHDILLPGTPDHGHYCIPLIAKGLTLGVINIYIKPGHERNELEENFLEAVANTLAGILIQRYYEDQKKEIKKKLHQSQKMESIGTLAGGIAHDFNNILSGIFGHAQLTTMNLDKPEKAKAHIDQINKGAKRATDLIQQILTFSRKSEQEKKPIQLSLIVKETIQFLRSSIPADIKIIEDISSRAKVKADPTQIHQIVMNLCTNAYHSMKDIGGELSVSLSEIEIQNSIQDLNIDPGRYLKLVVDDTGFGMPPEILNKIFEPYFTTKRVGEGTGLGLAVVLGIIEDHNGHIKAYSAAGKGSSFHVYLPIFKNDLASSASLKKENKVEGGTERIMLIDDEESILTSTSELLKNYGYDVKGFFNADIAFNAFENNNLGFDLIITDMTMPGMSGDEFAQKILAVRNDIPIILCTGFSNKMSKDKALRLGIKEYVQKPIDGEKMLFMIRKILNNNKS